MRASQIRDFPEAKETEARSAANLSGRNASDERFYLRTAARRSGRFFVDTEDSWDPSAS